MDTDRRPLLSNVLCAASHTWRPLPPLAISQAKQPRQTLMQREQDRAARSEQLLALLEPWYRLFRDMACAPMETGSYEDAEDAILWFGTVQGPDFPTRPRRPQLMVLYTQLQAMELLALLARADWKVWGRVLHKIWPQSCSKWRHLVDEASPRIVGVELRLDKYDELDVLEPARGFDPSPVFCGARDLLVSMVPEHRRPVVDVPVRISVEYKWDLLTRIVEVVAKHQDDDEAAIAGRYNGLRIHSIKLEDWRNTPGRQCVHLLLDAVSRGVHVRDLGMIDYDVFHGDPKLYLSAVQTLFALDGSAVDGIRSHGVNEFKYLYDTRHEIVPSVFSAIRSSRSLHSVEFDLSDEAVARQNRQLVLSWMAYAVFRRENTNPPIRELTLRVETLTQADLNVMDTILNVQDPLVPLVDRCVSAQGETISAKSFSLFDPIAAGRVLVRGRYESLQVVHNLAVLRRTEVWTTVLLPGWGQAWVHCDDVLEQHRASSTTASPVHLISRLALVNVPGNSDAVLGLLQRVGGGLQHLKISPHPYDSFDEPFCGRLFPVCPTLVSLEIFERPLDSLQAILDGYISGECRLKRLALVLEYGDRQVEDLVGALGDCNHPIAHCLEEFVYCWEEFAYPQHQHLTSPVMIAGLATMLQHNHHLRVLDLKTFCRKSSRSTLMRLMQPVLAFDGQQLAVRASRTSQSDRLRKLAFLSSLASREEYHGRDRAIEKLDARVVTLIFEFATRCLRRRVSVSLDYRGVAPPTRGLRVPFPE